MRGVWAFPGHARLWSAPPGSGSIQALLSGPEGKHSRGKPDAVERAFRPRAKTQNLRGFSPRGLVREVGVRVCLRLCRRRHVPPPDLLESTRYADYRRKILISK